MKRTESSMAKISKTLSSSNIVSSSKSAELSDSSDSSKPKGPIAKRRSNFSKKLAFHASSPNLAGLEPDLEPSNLLSSTQLSLSISTPDLLDIDTQPKRYSTGTPKRPPRAEGRVIKGGGRLSLPSKATDSAKSTKKDKDLMPPPFSTLPSKSQQDSKRTKQDVFLKRATQAKRQTSSDMTLDQAKSILMGKSGILEDKKSKDASVKSNNTVTIRPLHNTTFHVHSVSSTYPDFSSEQDHLDDPTLQGITTEIESTVSELRRKSVIDAAFQNLTDLDASPLDLPERDSSPRPIKPHISSVQDNSSPRPIKPHNSSVQDNSSPRPIKPHISSVQDNSSPRPIKPHISSVQDNSSNSTSVYTKDNSAIKLTTGKKSSKDIVTQINPSESEENSIALGVRERIAMLNAQSSPRSSEEGSPRCSSPRLTNSSKINLTTTKPQTKVVTNLSPPDSSGIGSSLDSDTATKMFSSNDGISPPSGSTKMFSSNDGISPPSGSTKMFSSSDCISPPDGYEDIPPVNTTDTKSRLVSLGFLDKLHLL
jgi:hypothetical protein